MNTAPQQYIELRKNRDGQDRPYVVGTRTRVQDIVIEHERFGQTAEEIARGLPQLTLAQVHAALAFFFENRSEMWACIHEDEAYAERLKQQSDQAAAQTDADHATLPS